MPILVFGNTDSDLDNRVFDVIKQFKDLSFTIVNPNADLPLSDHNPVVIIDTVAGINQITLFSQSDLNKIVSPPRTTTHDYDLGFQLKYLKKIGKLPKLTLIGLPQTGPLDYDLLHSTLRKLVAQDIHGS